MARTFDIDAAIRNERPSAILRGQEFLFADLKLREKISRARHLQAKQEALDMREEELSKAIQDAVWQEEAEISEEEIKEEREEIAEAYAEVVEELIKLTVVKPVYAEGKDGDPGDEYKFDDDLRIVTKPFPDNLLEDLTEMEVQALNQFVEDATDQEMDIPEA